MESISEEKFDEIEFSSNEEMIKYLKKKTEEFNIIDFYNQKKDVSGLILITPEQMIEVHPISYHHYAIDNIYKLLYDYGFNEEIKKVTNNIIIRLVSGSSFQFYSIIPETINQFQGVKLFDLIYSLQNYHNDINFEDGEGYAEALFEETYKDSRNKMVHTPVCEPKKRLLRDNYIITNNKNNSL